MREIKLTQGKIALVDDEDFKRINQYNWVLDRRKRILYATRKNQKNKVITKIYLHRFIMNAQKDQMIDHKDGNGLNNQKKNLRFCTQSQNCKNRIPSINGTSKYLGVSWYKRAKRYIAEIKHKGKHLHIGTFKNEGEAAIAYNIAALKYHKEFARLNLIL